MLSSKIRTAAVTLIASGFVAMSFVPAVSQAKPINPYRKVTTTTAVKKQVVSGPCKDLGEMLNEDLQRLDAAHRSGNTEEATRERERANDAYKTGYENECGFTM